MQLDECFEKDIRVAIKKLCDVIDILKSDPIKPFVLDSTLKELMIAYLVLIRTRDDVLKDFKKKMN